MKVIYRCKRARCGLVRRIDYPLARGNRSYRLDAKRGEVGAGSDYTCVCGGYARGFEIRAELSSHACDARCMNAIGPNCECACGGVNHGAGFDVIYSEAGEVLPAAAQQITLF